MGINSNEAVADLNEEVTKNDLPGVPEGFANLSQVQKQDYLNGSIGTGLNTPVQPIFQYVNVPYNLRYKLRAARIGVEVVDALMSLAVYDSNEKILKIRKDADLEHVENYIESVILPDLEVKLDEKSGEITLPTPLNLSGEPEEMPKPQTEPQPTPEPIIESTPEKPKPFDADKIGSLTEDFEKSKTEDVTDILNQPHIPVEPKKEEVLVQEQPIEPELKRNGAMPKMGNIMSMGEDLSEEKSKEHFDNPRLVVKNDANPDESRKTDGGVETPSIAEPDPTENLVKMDYDPNNENPRELLDRLRVAVAGIADDYRKGLVGPEYLEEAAQNYSNARDRVRGQIREEIRAGNSSDAPEELEKKINDTLFDELVKRDHDERIKARRQVREGNVVDKAVETAKNLLGTKAAKWYLGLSRKQRLALSFGIGTAAGLTLGAGVGAFGALGYVGKRIASGTAGVAAGEWAAKRWSVEDLNQKEKEEIEDLKNANFTLDYKLKAISEIQQRYKKERIKMAAKKMGVTALAGAGTGLLGNLVESTFGGMGGSGSVLENKKESGGFEQNKMHRSASKFGQESIKPNPTDQEMVAVNKEVKTEVDEMQNTETIKPEAKPEVIEKPKVVEVPEAPKMSFKPEDLVHEVKTGDSTWNILKEVLKHDERFKNLSGTGTPQEIAEQIEAKQTRVLHDVLAKSLKNYNEYNIGPNGEIKVGDKVDFSKLFVNAQEYDEIIKDAENLKPTQISSIIESNRKIETWLKENSGKKFDLDEIMSTKPKVFVMPKPEMVEPKLPDAPELEKLKVSLAEGVEALKPISPDLPETTLQDQAGLTEEVIVAKKKLGILEDSQRLRTMSSDTLEVAQNAEIREAVEGVLRNEVNDIYGVRGWFKKVAGVDTKEWKTIAGLPAQRVLEYFKSPETSDLPKTILAELQTSEKHRKLVERINELVVEAGKHSNADFDPKGDESIVDYLRRIGGSLMRQQIESRTLRRAA